MNTSGDSDARFSLIAPLWGAAAALPLEQTYQEHKFMQYCFNGERVKVEGYIAKHKDCIKEAYPTRLSGRLVKVTGLHIACFSGQHNVVRLLLSEGAAPNFKTDNNYTPLYTAATCGFPDIVSTLLNYQADPGQGPTITNWLPYHKEMQTPLLSAQKALVKASPQKQSDFHKVINLLGGGGEIRNEQRGERG